MKGGRLRLISCGGGATGDRDQPLLIHIGSLQRLKIDNIHTNNLLLQGCVSSAMSEHHCRLTAFSFAMQA